MVNEKIRKALDELVEDQGLEDGIKYLDNHAYDNSIVGVTEDGIVIYDEQKMIEELMSDEEWSYEEAVEWLDYNTKRAIPYFGDKAPIIINPISDIMERYGN